MVPIPVYIYMCVYWVSCAVTLVPIHMYTGTYSYLCVCLLDVLYYDTGAYSCRRWYLFLHICVFIMCLVVFLMLVPILLKTGTCAVRRKIGLLKDVMIRK